MRGRGARKDASHGTGRGHGGMRATEAAFGMEV